MEVLKARVIKNYEGVKWCPSPGAPGLLWPRSAQQELYALASGLRQPSSSCDYADVDPEHLLTSEQLITESQFWLAGSHSAQDAAI